MPRTPFLALACALPGVFACLVVGAPQPLPGQDAPALRPVDTDRPPVLFDGFGAVAEIHAPSFADVAPRVTIAPDRSGWKRVEVAWNFPKATPVDDLAVTLRLLFRPEFRWQPHLSPIPGTVVSEHVYRSPAVIVALGERHYSVVPDLDLCRGDRERLDYLDVDAGPNHIVIGRCRQSVPLHVLYRKEPGMVVGPGVERIAFLVHGHVDRDVPSNPFGPAAAMLWRRHARPLVAAGEPWTAPLEKHVEETYAWLDAWQDRIWHEFSMGGRDVGGAQLLLDLSWSRGFPGAPIPIRFEIWNQAWFSALRSAEGMLRHGRQHGDRALLLRAQRAKALALSAPQNGDGLFPAVFAADPSRGHYGAPPTVRDWQNGVWTGSDRVPAERGISRGHYHLVDSSTTGLWMLRWYRDVEPDPELLDYCERYAAGLVGLQDHKGFLPAWVDPVTGEPERLLADSPETAQSATFLLELAAVNGDDFAFQAGIRAIDAVLDGPAPDGRWEDFETYWSDNDLGRLTHVGRRFERNGVFKQNTLSIFWTAEACLRAWQLTGVDGYLRQGRRYLDELSMWQQVWQPPQFPVRTVGGFGVMNADGEWSDARQSLFAELYLDYYLELGDPELFERGAAALRAAFTLVYGDLATHARSAWEARFPFLVAEDQGFANENHAHFGIADPAGAGLVYFTIFDWGAGAAAAAAARILDRFGHVYVDRERGQAFHVDSLAVRWDPVRGVDVRERARPPQPGRSVRVVYEDGTSERAIVGR